MLSKNIKWQNELDIFSKFKSLFIIDGNISDYQLVLEGDKVTFKSLQCLINDYYTDQGYKTILFFDHISGFSTPFINSTKGVELVNERLSENSKLIVNSKNLTQVNLFSHVTKTIRLLMSDEYNPTVIVVNLASYLIQSTTNMDDNDFFLFTELLKSSKVQQNNSKKNIVILLADNSNKIPAFLFVDNYNAKVLNIPKPNEEIRNIFIDSFYDNFDSDSKNIVKNKFNFINNTDGFSIVDLTNLLILMKTNNFKLEEIEKAASIIKYGIQENPWSSNALKKKLPMLEQTLSNRVKGQSDAIKQSIDIISRSILGLSGLQHSSNKSKPKGIMFLAGATGVGKTELAKSLAEWLFGSEDSCIRFDMSEYQQPHSDQKLLGAPPGYIGHESGGQLTNAVKNNPFSILLFDEIEKAHPSILDKFIQILEDGRMTDSKGETVYFSNCLIVFTSNLGIYKKDKLTNEKVLAVDSPYTNTNFNFENFKHTIMKNIKSYFNEELGRPEILNRIGENFIIFNYISKEASYEIIQNQLTKITNKLFNEFNIELIIKNNAIISLVDFITSNLSQGGRGIGNIIEKCLINPLSRYLILENNVKKFTIHNIVISQEVIFEYDVK